MITSIICIVILGRFLFSFREWDDDLFSTTCKILSEEMAVPISVEEGMAEYRLTLCLSFLYKFFVFVRSQILPGAVSSRELSVLTVTRCNL